MMKTELRQKKLLGDQDPEPVTFVNASSRSPLFLVCEHAGSAIPHDLGDLGLTGTAMEPHRYTDIGAEPLAHAIAEHLKAPLVLQRYSRLVIDCNRPPQSSEAVPAQQDGIVIPGNLGLPDDTRITEIFTPFDTAIEQGLTRSPRKLAISVHSFTPRLVGGPPRPWHCGFLSRRDTTTAQRLMQAVADQDAALVLAVNEPYQIDDETDWFIPAHAEPMGLAHTLIEVRNDLLATPSDVAHWAGILSRAILKLPELQ